MLDESEYQFLDKPGISIDERLQELGDSFVNFIEEVEELPLTELDNTVLIGSMKNTDTVISKQNYLFFSWSYPSGFGIRLEELQKIEFVNNLGSLIDYRDGFSSPLIFIFPLLECIRKHFNSQKVYFVGDYTSVKFYMKV